MTEINENFIHTKYGYCYYEIEPGKNPIVFNLYVHPEYRRRGHAKKILNYVLREIRMTGYGGEIDIEAAPREQSINREDLEKFYKGMGLNVVSQSAITQLQSNSTALTDTIRLLIEDSERLEEFGYKKLYFLHNGEFVGYRCWCTEGEESVEIETQKNKDDVKHSDSCPIALHRVLMKKLEKDWS